MLNKLSEWDLMKKISSNECDRDEFYSIIGDESLDFKDKPRAVKIAMLRISLTKEEVAHFKKFIAQFVSTVNIEDQKIGWTTSMRFEILKDLLEEL
ncbi:hypothetical protein [Photobacterium damselae]|uniref:hypothetical protein n=1 Tax=Photobacterium damselae TaxID=38293 RepID=UPI001F2D0E19|nr:hypothetical protein [Photobacterium damselae]UKA04937.1 hypothetical protein IHC89_22085 [Photobacterium damselae subsp. damselae]